jgi:hypothetical protein
MDCEYYDHAMQKLNYLNFVLDIINSIVQLCKHT